MSDLTFTFSGDASSLKAALSDIKSAVSSTKSSVGSLASAVTTAFAAATAAIGGSFLAINAAAQRETLSTAFIPLLGSVDAAQKRMQELAHFAATTPFQLNDVAQASKTLQTLTNGALATGDGLRLVGDVASSTNTPFAEIAVTIGRLYSGLDSGRPVGEAMARLQELGAISPQVRSKLEDLQKAGKQGSEVWAVAAQDLGRFSNAMELQSATWSGKVSTMQDAWGELLVKIGQPLMLALTPALEALTATFEQLSGVGSQFGAGLGSVFATIAEGMNTALSLVVPFAQGLASITEFLGGTQTVVASLAAALLLYGTNTKIASTSTVSFTAQLARLKATMAGLSLTSVTQSFKAGFASMLASARASAFGMRTVWSITMNTMATVTRVSLGAIKSVIASTGVGLLLVGISEGLSALYSWWNSNDAASRQASASAAQYQKTIQSIENQAKSVKTGDQLDSFMSSLDGTLGQLQEALSQAEIDGDDGLSATIQRQVSALSEKKKFYEETLPLQMEAALQADREAKALARVADEQKKAREEMLNATQKLRDLERDSKKTDREEYLSNLPDSALEVKLRLADSGLDSQQALEAEMAVLSKEANTGWGVNEAQLSRYKELLELQKKIKSLTKEQGDEERAKAEARAKTSADYAHQVALLHAEIAGNDLKIKQLEREQRIIELSAEYRKQGYASAVTMAEQLVELEANAEAARTKRERAKREADMKTDNSPQANRMGGQFIQSGQSGVGGGGRSILIGGSMLSESKKQSNLLSEIRDRVAEPPNISVSGNVTAVIGG